MLCLLLLFGCWGTTHVAELSDAHGLADDAPVLVSGVVVGHTSAPRLGGDRVQVDLRIEHPHELTLHTDACVQVIAFEGRPALELLPGTEGALEGPVQECSVEHLLDVFGRSLKDAVETLRDATPQLGRQLGEAAREAVEQFEEGLAGEAERPEVGNARRVEAQR